MCPFCEVKFYLLAKGANHCNTYTVWHYLVQYPLRQIWMHYADLKTVIINIRKKDKNVFKVHYINITASGAYTIYDHTISKL